MPFVSGAKLAERAASYQPHAVFVDIHLGTEESGLVCLPHLRSAWPHTPILVMTSDTNSSLIGQALSLGANDFIRKPLDPDELQARLLARVCEMKQREEGGALHLADLACDRATRTIVGPSGRRHLSASEWELLTYLVQNPGMTIAKSLIKGKVWGDIKVSDNSVDRKISTVRRALSEVSQVVRIASSYGQGISLVIADDPAHV